MTPDSDHRPEQPSGLRATLAQRLRDLPANHASSPAYVDSKRANSGIADGQAAAADHLGDDTDTSLDDLEPSFRAQVPGFERLRDEHCARWPDRERPDRRRPDDPPGSWRGDGGRFLTPEQNTEAAKLIAELRGHEEAITAKLKEIEKDNAHGGVLVGLSHRLKGDDRLKEKIADELAKKPGSSTAEVVADIWDALRYTFRFGRDVYADGYGDISARMDLAGLSQVPGKNHWTGNPEYKGANTRWVSADGGRFELQFHTPESHYAKEHLTHTSYERLREGGTRRAERAELMEFQQRVCAAIPVPSGVERI